jgi:hypothetical protein
VIVPFVDGEYQRYVVEDGAYMRRQQVNREAIDRPALSERKRSTWTFFSPHSLNFFIAQSAAA